MCSCEKFVELHQAQLRGIDLPEGLWPRLYEKLVPAEVLDAGDTFEIHKDGADGEPSLVVRQGKHLAARSDVFLARHLFFSDGSSEAKRKLESSPSLLERLEKMMLTAKNDVSEEPAEADMRSFLAQQLNVDEREANQLLLDSNFEIINAILRHEGYYAGGSLPQLSSRVPAQLKHITFDEFKLSLHQSLGDDAPEDDSELHSLYQNFLKKRNATHEEDRKCVEHVTARYVWHQEGEDGTVTVSVTVPKTAGKKDISSKLIRNHWTFGVKGSAPLVDGDLFLPCVPDESYWTFGEAGVVVMTVQKHDINTGWEEFVKGEVQLDEHQLEERALKLQQIAKRRVPLVLQRMWLYNQTYQAVTRDGSQRPVWYIMDEVGSALQHSNNANYRCSPFICALTGRPYSVFWPVRDVSEGESCTRDFAPPLLDVEAPLQHQARLWLWSDEACRLDGCPNQFHAAYRALHDMMERCEKERSSTGRSSHQEDSDSGEQSGNQSPVKIGLVKVFVDKAARLLPWSSCTNCELVKDAASADWVCVLSQSSALGKVIEKQRVNRIAGDECLLDRTLLYYMMRKSGLGCHPWYVPTYDLHRQLPELLSHHWQRGVCCRWLVQPARSDVTAGLRSILSSDVRRVARLGESIPAVASAYSLLTDVVLAYRYMLHYAVAVYSVKPLAAYMSLQPVIVRAKRPCSDDYVSEYEEDERFVLPGCRDKEHGQVVNLVEFEADFNKEHSESGVSFQVIQYSVARCMADVLQAAADHLEPHSGSDLLPCAIYGADMVLRQNDLQPLLFGFHTSPFVRSSHPGGFPRLVQLLATQNPSRFCRQHEDELVRLV